MKKIKEFLKGKSILMLFVMLSCALLGVVDASSMAAEVVAPTAETDGVTILGDAVTDQVSREEGDGIVLNDIDRKVVKIRPMGNPLEQIARFANKVHCTSPKHEYASTDTLPCKSTVATAYTATGAEQAEINLASNKIFSVKETLLFPFITGGDELGASNNEWLMLYIVGKSTDGKLIVKPVNGIKSGDTVNTIPSIPLGSKVIRAGRAHNEIDMQTAPYAKIPSKTYQYMQTFRAQVEQSTLAKIEKKEVDWTFSDDEEEAVFDMKRGMNKSFFLGSKRFIYDLQEKRVYFTGGIWYQAGQTFAYGTSVDDLQMTEEMLVDLSKTCFTGNAGNKKKIFLVGSELMANLSKIKRDRVINDQNTVTKFGIEFEIIKTNFGKFWVILDESMDELGLSDSGLVFDANLLRKIYYKELESRDFDKRKDGTSDVDARAITEMSGLILQNPNAHTKVIPTTVEA